MYSNTSMNVILAILTLGVSVSGLAPARGGETAGEGDRWEIVSLINILKEPPDYIKGGEFAVEGFYYSDHATPIALAVAANGDVYATSNGLVQYYSSTGSLKGKWALPAFSDYYGWYGLAITPDDGVLVADRYGERISEFSATGSFVAGWPADVGAITVNPGGYVYGSNGHRVKRYAPDGASSAEWGTPDTRAGDFPELIDLAAGPDGTIYALDSALRNVQYFTPEGSFQGRWGPEGCEFGKYVRPSAIAIGPDGKVFISEDTGLRTNSRFDYFTSTGSFLGSFDLPEWAGIYYGPGMAVSRDGTVYLSDRYSGRICYYKPSRIYYVIRYVVIGVFSVVGIFVIAVLVRFSLRKLKRLAAC